MQCCAHILNLIIKDGLEIIYETIENFHESVAFRVLYVKEMKSLEKQPTIESFLN